MESHKRSREEGVEEEEKGMMVRVQEYGKAE